MPILQASRRFRCDIETWREQKNGGEHENASGRPDGRKHAQSKDRVVYLDSDEAKECRYHVGAADLFSQIDRERSQDWS